MLGFPLSAGHGLSGPIYRVDQVPEPFQEHYIVRGYRHPKSSVTQCLLSLFDPTNETLNFWTHFLPTWYFVWVLFHLSESFQYWTDSYSWPLLCFLLVCCAFPLASALAHLFNVMSVEARDFCFFLDYSALSMFSCGVAITYRAYCFPSQLLADGGAYTAWYRDNYVNISVLNAVLCTYLSCKTRFMTPGFPRKLMRLTSFAAPYWYDSLPIVYRLVYCTPEECQLGGQHLFLRQFLLVILSAFLYISHFPERLLPGSFDIVGHSHQLFHVTSIMAVMDQLQAILLDIKERKDFVKARWDFDSPSNSIGVMALVFLSNAFIIVCFTVSLFKGRKCVKSS